MLSRKGVMLIFLSLIVFASVVSAYDTKENAFCFVYDNGAFSQYWGTRTLSHGCNLITGEQQQGILTGECCGYLEEREPYYYDQDGFAKSMNQYMTAICYNPQLNKQCCSAEEKSTLCNAGVQCAKEYYTDSTGDTYHSATCCSEGQSLCSSSWTKDGKTYHQDVCYDPKFFVCRWDPADYDFNDAGNCEDQNPSESSYIMKLSECDCKSSSGNPVGACVGKDVILPTGAIDTSIDEKVFAGLLGCVDGDLVESEIGNPLGVCTSNTCKPSVYKTKTQCCDNQETEEEREPFGSGDAICYFSTRDSNGNSVYNDAQCYNSAEEVCTISETDYSIQTPPAYDKNNKKPYQDFFKKYSLVYSMGDAMGMNPFYSSADKCYWDKTAGNQLLYSCACLGNNVLGGCSDNAMSLPSGLDAETRDELKLARQCCGGELIEKAIDNGDGSYNGQVCCGDSCGFETGDYETQCCCEKDGDGRNNELCERRFCEAGVFMEKIEVEVGGVRMNLTRTELPDGRTDFYNESVGGLKVHVIYTSMPLANSTTISVMTENGDGEGTNYAFTQPCGHVKSGEKVTLVGTNFDFETGVSEGKKMEFSIKSDPCCNEFKDYLVKANGKVISVMQSLSGQQIAAIIAGNATSVLLTGITWDQFAQVYPSCRQCEDSESCKKLEQFTKDIMEVEVSGTMYDNAGKADGKINGGKSAGSSYFIKKVSSGYALEGVAQNWVTYSDRRTNWDGSVDTHVTYIFKADGSGVEKTKVQVLIHGNALRLTEEEKRPRRYYEGEKEGYWDSGSMTLSETDEVNSNEGSQENWGTKKSGGTSITINAITAPCEKKSCESLPTITEKEYEQKKAEVTRTVNVKAPIDAAASNAENKVSSVLKEAQDKQKKLEIAKTMSAQAIAILNSLRAEADDSIESKRKIAEAEQAVKDANSNIARKEKDLEKTEKQIDIANKIEQEKVEKARRELQDLKTPPKTFIVPEVTTERKVVSSVTFYLSDENGRITDETSGSSDFVEEGPWAKIASGEGANCVQYYYKNEKKKMVKSCACEGTDKYVDKNEIEGVAENSKVPTEYGVTAKEFSRAVADVTPITYEECARNRILWFDLYQGLGGADMKVSENGEHSFQQEIERILGGKEGSGKQVGVGTGGYVIIDGESKKISSLYELKKNNGRRDDGFGNWMDQEDKVGASNKALRMQDVYVSFGWSNGGKQCRLGAIQAVEKYIGTVGFFRYDATAPRENRDENSEASIPFFVDLIGDSNFASDLKSCKDYDAYDSLVGSDAGVCLNIKETYGVIPQGGHWGVSTPIVKQLFMAYVRELVYINQGVKTPEKAEADFWTFATILKKYVTDDGYLSGDYYNQFGPSGTFTGLAISDVELESLYEQYEDDYMAEIFTEENFVASVEENPEAFVQMFMDEGNIDGALALADKCLKHELTFEEAWALTLKYYGEESEEYFVYVDGKMHYSDVDASDFVCNSNLNSDDAINDSDYEIFFENYKSENCDAGNNWCGLSDVNKDGKVLADDYVILYENYGADLSTCVGEVKDENE